MSQDPRHLTDGLIHVLLEPLDDGRVPSRHRAVKYLELGTEVIYCTVYQGMGFFPCLGVEAIG